MEVIKLDRVVSVNSEIQGHGAQNILDGDIRPNKNWMCEKGTDRAVVIVQLERAVILTSIHIGNAHSAFVEVLVGKAADSSDQFESLIPMSTFMNPHESKTGNNPNRTRFFNKEDFNESAAGKSWDRLKIVCSQPFNKYVPYGLCFFKVHGEKEGRKMEVPTPRMEEEIPVGSFFKKKRASDGEKKLSVSEQIKEAEKESSLAQHTPLNITKISAKMNEKQAMQKKTKPEEEPQAKKRKLDVTPKVDEKKKEKEKEEEKKKKEKEEEKKKKEETRKKEEKKKEKEKKKKNRKKPFEELMNDVVLVISGYQNPLRGNIRSMAIEMGAKYSGDWESHCTHLVCAYENTPKFNQVKGKGKIVRKEWVEKCHSDKKRYPWRRFALDKSDGKKPESEEEIDGEEESEHEEMDVRPSTSRMETPPRKENKKKEREEEESHKKSEEDEYEALTDEDDRRKSQVDTSDYPMPHLPDMFTSKTFYLDPKLKHKPTLERYIIAYNGILTETFDEDVEFYVTEKGGAPLELFRKKTPNLVAVKPSWILGVNSELKFIPVTPYLVK